MSPRLVLGALALVASCARPAPSAPVRCDHGATGSSAAVVPLRGALHVLAISGGNVVLSRGADGLVIVDARSPEVATLLGHGRICTMIDLRRFATMLHDTTRSVRRARAEGASLADVTKRGLGPGYAGWEWGLVSESTWIELVWGSGGER